MQVRNQSDIPSRYLKPYTLWVFAECPKVRPAQDSETQWAMQWPSLSAAYTNLNERTFGPQIKTFGYYTPYPGSPVPAEEYTTRYRAKNETREVGARETPEELSVYFPPCPIPHNGGTPEYLEELFLRLYNITAHIGGAMGYFGSAPLPDCGLPLYRQQCVLNWTRDGRNLLHLWRTGYPHPDKRVYSPYGQGGPRGKGTRQRL